MKGLKKWKDVIFVVVVIAAVLGPAAPRSYAAAKIRQVNVKFVSEEFDSDGFPQIEAVTKDNAHYQVAFCEAAEALREETFFEWDFDDFHEGIHSYNSSDMAEEHDRTGIYIVEITADEGYQFRFSSADKERIHLSGIGAVLLVAEQEDNGHTLRLTVRLERLNSYTGQIESASWNGCKGEWSESTYAVGYRLRLADPEGNYHYAETSGTCYDFAPLMLISGIYHYDVRAVSKEGRYGEWVSSERCTVECETAKENQSVYAVEKINWRIDESMPHTPDNNRVIYLNTGWQKTAEGEYWYRNPDGTYPQNVWQMIDGSWYYFWGSGYMAHDSYVNWKHSDYYLLPDGRMAVNSQVPDGRRANELGILSEFSEDHNYKEKP